MDVALIRRLGAEYLKQLPPDQTGYPVNANNEVIYPQPVEELLAELAQAGVKIDREKFVSLFANVQSLDAFSELDATEDWDWDSDSTWDVVKQLAIHWLPERVLGEEMLDLVCWLELHFPERADPLPEPGAEPATADKPSSEAKSPLPEAPEPPKPAEPETVLAAVTAILDWLALGPAEPAERFADLESFHSDVGVLLENTLSHLVRQRPSETLALAERLAKLTDSTFDWGLYADLLAERGRLAEAEDLYRRNMEREPWNVFHPKNYAHLLVEHGPPSDRQRARDLLDGAEKLATERLAAATAGRAIPLASLHGRAEPEPTDADDDFEDEGDGSPSPVAEATDELSMVLDEQAVLAQMMDDQPRSELYVFKILQLVQQRAATAFDDEEDDFDDDLGDDDLGDEEPTPTILPPKPRVEVGRNDPCPCGSGKKYKQCCWLKS